MKWSTLVTWAAIAYVIYELSQGGPAGAGNGSAPACSPNLPMAHPMNAPAWLTQLNNKVNGGSPQQIGIGGLG